MEDDHKNKVWGRAKMKKKSILKQFTVFEAILLLLGSIVVIICFWQAFNPPEPLEKPKLSELSEKECLEFVALRGIVIPKALRDSLAGETVKKMIVAAEKEPGKASTSTFAEYEYLSECIRKAVNEYYHLYYDNYRIEWNPDFTPDYEKGQQKLSELSEAECIEFLVSHGLALQNGLDSGHYGEFIKELVIRIEENPYDALPYNNIDVGYIVENIQKVVNAHYDIFNERPPLSELSEAASLEFITSRGIEIPPALKNGNVGEIAKVMIERADKYPYSPSPYNVPYEALFYGSIEKAVNEYYDIFDKTPRLSELADAECFEFLASHGIEIPPALKNDFGGDFVKYFIARSEEHPYAYPTYNDIVFMYYSEGIRKVVNEYYGIYKDKKILSEMSEEECIEFILTSGIRLPYGSGGESFGETIKMLITDAEKHPWGIATYSASQLVYLADSIRKVVNEYYYLHYGNYRHLEWHPEFEAEYYNN